MRPARAAGKPTVPVLLDRAQELIEYLRTLSASQVARRWPSPVTWPRGPRAVRRLEHRPRPPGAGGRELHRRYLQWTAGRLVQAADRRYADAHLRILSGLYGILRPFDGISPYRLEMGYRLPDRRYANLYRYWGSAIADQLPPTGPDREPRRQRVQQGRAAPCGCRAGWSRRGSSPSTEHRASRGSSRCTRRSPAARSRAGSSRPGRRPADAARLRRHRLPARAVARAPPREPAFVCTEFGGKGLSVRLEG